MAFKISKATEILTETRVWLFAHVSLYRYKCVSTTPCVPVREVLLEYCVHCSKVCVSVFCCSSSRNLCVFLPSGTGGGKATAAAGVTAGQRSEGRKAAAAKERLQVCTALHTLEPFSGAICPSICIAPSRANWIATECWLSSFLCHRCRPTTPDLSYFLGCFYHLVVAVCLFV